MNISSFANLIHHARKSTGIVLADERFQEAVHEFELAGYSVVDMVSLYDGRLFRTDDQLVDKMRLMASNKPVLIVNLELFIAPRLGDGNFVEQFARKIVVAEPRQPIIILFYSPKIFSTFSTIYHLNTLTQRHTLDLIDDSDSDKA